MDFSIILKSGPPTEGLYTTIWLVAASPMLACWRCPWAYCATAATG
jgi:hypothetical protein